MLTPIRPSLSQALLKPNATPIGSTASNTPLAGNSQMASPPIDRASAQRAFFRNATGQAATGVTPTQAPAQSRTITPPTFRATDIAQTQSASANPLKPGSLLNIVV